jgi:four helix bundle protein
MRQRLYEKLIVWREAHALCLWIYEATKLFPANEHFGIINQMRRSSYSVPTNIAEGNGRRSSKEKNSFYRYCHRVTGGTSLSMSTFRGIGIFKTRATN